MVFEDTVDHIEKFNILLKNLSSSDKFFFEDTATKIVLVVFCDELEDAQTKILKEVKKTYKINASNKLMDNNRDFCDILTKTHLDEEEYQSLQNIFNARHTFAHKKTRDAKKQVEITWEDLTNEKNGAITLGNKVIDTITKALNHQCS